MIVTRGHRDDMSVLAWAVKTEARYIGMIGSKRKVLSVYKALENDGFAPELFERVHAPVGLNIGALTPEEIAISIAAELIAERRGAKAWRIRPSSARTSSALRWFRVQPARAGVLAAVILSAGESSRMGSPKALVPFRGRTFLERLLAAVEANRIVQIPGQRFFREPRNRLDARGAWRSRARDHWPTRARSCKRSCESRLEAGAALLDPGGDPQFAARADRRDAAISGGSSASEVPLPSEKSSRSFTNRDGQLRFRNSAASADIRSFLRGVSMMSY